MTGTVLAHSTTPRGRASSREPVGTFALRAQAVLVTSGGIGGDHDLVRAFWPDRLGSPPERMISGVPAHVDGRMLAIAEKAGARLVNRDRMWHYTEGVENWDPIWARHGIRILPGPSALWFDARGRRLPAPNFPGFDTLGTLAALPGDRPRPLLVRADHEDPREGVRPVRLGAEPRSDRARPAPACSGASVPVPPAPVRAFLDRGADFVVADSLPDLVAGMNAPDRASPRSTSATLERQIVARDRELANPFTKDLQVMAIHNARRHRGDRLLRTAEPHRILDPAAGPLVAVRLHVLTRKTLGGLQTDLSSRVLDAAGAPDRRAVRGGRGGRVRRRRGARLPSAGGHVPGRLSVRSAPGGPGRGAGGPMRVLRAVVGLLGAPSHYGRFGFAAAFDEVE